MFPVYFSGLSKWDRVASSVCHDFPRSTNSSLTPLWQGVKGAIYNSGTRE